MVDPRATAILEEPDAASGQNRKARPTAAQRAWLVCGLAQPGGKLPLFDPHGRSYSPRTIQSCLAQGWAEPWIDNPIKPDWLICKLTASGRAAVSD